VQVAEYDLLIDLDFELLKFRGQLLAALKTEENVVLNAVGLNIRQVKAGLRDLRFSQRGEDLIIESGAFDGTVEVDYEGSVPDSLAGIYRAQYDGGHIITTHFAAAQARRMFPCVDRPDAKAVFKLGVRIDKDLHAISNMPVESERPEGDKKFVTFRKTPRMSTYLLYLGVGRFEERARKFGKTEIIMATRPGKIEMCRFAQQEAEKALAYLESYFGIPFALPKVHMIAVPEFAAGAMENWGAITFRETRLLVDASTSTKIKMQVSLAITHELAHQWFGDLVTMKWWDDIWLNESFASFLTYKAVDTFHPEWRIWDNFVNGEPRVETLAGALASDCVMNTHPIEVPVSSPDEIEQIFDAISYGKGGHVLQMIEAYIGEDAFRDGVQRYLNAHAYGNATGSDLWSSLEHVSGKQVKKIMSQWIKRPGYPVVTASLRDGMLDLKQERFLISAEPDGSTWPIPLIFEINGERKNLLLENAEEQVEAKDLKSLKINPDRTGFYLSRYVGLDEYVWRSKLSPFDRWGLIFDAFSFLLAGKMTFNEYLTVLNRFRAERDTLPAQEVSDQLGLLYALVPSKVSNVSREVHRAYLDLFRDRTDENSLILTGRVANRLVLLDESYASELGRQFKDFGNVPPDMRQAVALAYAASTNDFEGLVNMFRQCGSDEDKTKLLTAMSAFRDQSMVRRGLDFSLSGEVKRQDAIYVIASTADKPHAKNVAWGWLQDNAQKLRALYQSTGTMSLLFLHLIPILGAGRIQETEAFFQKHNMPDAEMGIRTGLEKLRAYDRLVTNIMNQ